MGRIRKGWDLTKKAWGVVRSNPGLLRLPIFGGLLALLALIVFGAGAFAALGDSESPTTAQQVTAGAIGLVGLYLASFSVIFFNVALAASADQAFQGQPVDTSYGIGVAKSRLGIIAAWALVAGLVSLFFAILRDRGGLAGQIAAGVGGALWSLITFLVIPVLAFEGIGPFAAIKRSGNLFKERWGQQITGNLAIGIITAIAFMVGAVIAVGGGYILIEGSSAAQLAGGGLLIAGLLIVVGAIVVSGAVRGVFGVALYRYVANEQTVGPFSADDLEGAVKIKGARA